jgi:phosphoglycolate phosphatase-like HAD superfamily hydrolase
LLLFDVDGTLLDSAGAGRAALEGAMVEVYGTSGPIDGFAFDGLTDPHIVRSLLSMAGLEDSAIDARLVSLWDSYDGRLEAELRGRRGRVNAYPGVSTLLERLEVEPRFWLGLLTGNVERGAWRKLRACDLDEPFSFGAFGSDAERRGDLPPIAMRRAHAATGIPFEREETILIGDTPEDIDCARAGGARVLAVATGRFSMRELEECGADWVLPGLDDVEVVSELLASA